MDDRTARILNEVNREFYFRFAASFSATRHTAWPGWTRLLDGPAAAALPPACDDARVLDVACGNLRFERFLLQQRPGAAWRFHAVDNCAPLVGTGSVSVSFHELDVMEALLDGCLADALPAGAFDLAACFGFLHHVPGFDNRAQLLAALAAAATPGGFAAVSFWQFLNSPQLASRARETHERGLAALERAGLRPENLEPGDYLLGWQGAEGAFRYCHAFDAGEVDALLEAAGLVCRVADSFEADGRTGNLNAYVVLG